MNEDCSAAGHLTVATLNMYGVPTRDVYQRATSAFTQLRARQDDVVLLQEVSDPGVVRALHRDMEATHDILRGSSTATGVGYAPLAFALSAGLFLLGALLHASAARVANVAFVMGCAVLPPVVVRLVPCVRGGQGAPMDFMGQFVLLKRSRFTRARIVHAEQCGADF